MNAHLIFFAYRQGEVLLSRAVSSGRERIRRSQSSPKIMPETDEENRFIDV